jgi:hypothetical protein
MAKYDASGDHRGRGVNPNLIMITLHDRNEQGKPILRRLHTGTLEKSDRNARKDREHTLATWYYTVIPAATEAAPSKGVWVFNITRTGILASNRLYRPLARKDFIKVSPRRAGRIFGAMPPPI